VSAAERRDATISTFDPSGWTVERLIEAKGSRRVTLCFPCRDEVATIGGLVTMARRRLVEATGLVDDLLVVDDRSVDGTGIAAAQAGARVVHIDDVHQRHGSGSGKGNVLWGSLLVSDGDFMVWCDGDLTSFTHHWVERLLAPLVSDDGVALVKATYLRPTHLGGGGRTTELVARPLLSLFAPALAELGQPLSGEFAGRRDALEAIPFVQGWGVEIALLLDIANRYGEGSITQVDLGVRHHRHRTLETLSVQAAEVMATFLSRIGRGCTLDSTTLRHADGSVIPLNLSERPAVSALVPTGAPQERTLPDGVVTDVRP
jgi:glucosyl-3-phosphoglycerate synthase